MEKFALNSYIYELANFFKKYILCMQRILILNPERRIIKCYEIELFIFQLLLGAVDCLVPHLSGNGLA